MKRGRPRDVAIVGMGCRFPGAADLFAYWANILANQDQAREVPADRWPLDVFHDPDSTANDRVACRRGGYLDAPVPFDSAAHGIMPLAVAGGEPEQFLILDAAHAALADADLDSDRLSGRRVEVVVGRGNYFNRGNLTRLQHGRIVAQTVGLLSAIHPEWSADDLDLLRQDLKSSLPPFEAATIPGQLTSATSGRLADRLNLTGAGFVVDAASASSLVALDLGCRALREGRADVALVGGVYVEADVDFPLVFSRLGALSKTGEARPFSADADGLISGEGVGVVVLKRLSDAERDGDRIYAVVKGVGLASDGRGRGLAAPSAKGHALAMRRAYRAARVKPETVGLIEGHGLGVPAADRAELRALRAVFPASKSGTRVLGAVSSQIGHAMPAAGMAGLIKAALSLHHRILPPTRHAERPHRLATEGGFELLNASRPWIHGDSNSPRRAGVNSFGFAGVNAHAVLEEHAASADRVSPGAMLDWDSEAFFLSADDRFALADRVRELRERLTVWGRDRIALKDLAHTLNTGREPHDGKVRLGLVAGSFDDLVRHLETVEPRLRDAACQRVRDARGLYFWQEPAGREGDGTLAFLFPGEGSQYPGMLADLCPHFPELRAELDKADKIALESGEAVPPSSHLFASSTSSPDALWATDTAVTAVLAAQWAMFQVLSHLGLKPDAVVGHSSGELPALAAAGAFETMGTLDLAFTRLAEVFRRLEAEGAIPEARLIAVGADRDRVEAVCRTHGGSVVVAIDNCPHQVVLAGPSDQAERVLAVLRAAGVMCEDLPFARAYHTPAFAAVMPPLEAFYASLDFLRPKTRVYSCSTAEAMPDDPAAMRRLAVAQWTRPVAFRETIEAMHRDGLRVFVDVGARGNLCGYVDDVLRGKSAFAVAANLPRRSGTNQLNHLAASLFAQGIPIDATYLYTRRRPQRIDLAAEPHDAKPIPGLDLGFPEMRLSDETLSRFRQADRDDRIPTEFTAAADDPSPIGIEEGPDDEAMLGYLSTMNAFLKTQSEVMGAFLMASGDGRTATFEAPAVFPVPGPWAGEIRAGEPGRWISTEYLLDASTDPIAAHHTLGGRRISALHPELKGLAVLPFFTMTEMAAQVASLVVPPGLTLASLEDARAHKWVEYEPDTLLAMHGECEPDDPCTVRVAMRQRKRGASTDPHSGRLVFEATVRFAGRKPLPEAPKPLLLNDPRPSRFTAARIYDEQWLFHGPAMQPLTELGVVGLDGIAGTLTIRPPDDLLRDGNAAGFHTDPVALDGFTQLLGCWGLDRLEEGDVIFPLHMRKLTLYDETPEVGTPVACQVHIMELERHRVRVDADLILPDGRVWARVEDWEDWRFHWPSRYRDGFRAPDAVLIGEPLSLKGVTTKDASAVWFAPPVDMGRPVWRDVLEHVQLGPDERAASLALGGPEVRRTHRLWGKIAAKEAARRIWLEQGGPPRFPADLAVTTDADGRPRLRDLAQPSRDDLPAISIAHAEGVVLALAASGRTARPGVDIVPVNDLTVDYKEAGFLNDSPDGAEWSARLLAARQAAGKAIGFGPNADMDEVEAADVDFEAQTVLIRMQGRPVALVNTERRKDHAWAWTLGTEV